MLEKERQTYIDAGFDGWILKPISFDRLQRIMLGIVDANVRKENLYKQGNWERGGWFGEAQADIFSAQTKPADRMPMSDPSKGAQIAAGSRDPFVREEDSSLQTQEQKMMADEQEKQNEETKTDHNAVNHPEVVAVTESAEAKPEVTQDEASETTETPGNASASSET